MRFVGVGLWALCAFASSEISSSCCSKLQEIPQLNKKVYMAGTMEYEERLDTYYSANAALHSSCMVMPESTEDVSAIMRVITNGQCPFGMSSGKHSAYRNSNAVEDGITVDFGYMNQTSYDSETRIAGIQPGSSWGHVYEALDQYGVAAVGGRASPVGVGGFITGGGYSFHSNVRGFSCSQVVNFEVVLADGRIVNVNKNENPDLWKSLKGGSGNLGFVTRIDQRVVESNKIWAGFINFEPSHRNAVFEKYIDFVENNDRDPASQLIVTMQWDGDQYNLISVVSNSDAVEAPPSFSDLLSVPSISNTTAKGNIAEVVPQFTGPTPLGLYANWMTGTTSNDIRVMKFVYDKFEEYVEKMRAVAPNSKFNVLVQFQPVTPSMVKHGQESGGNILGLENIVADGPVIMWLIAVTADTEEAQDMIDPLRQEFKDAVDTYATEMGINKDWVYLNYATGDQDPISHYGPDNIALIRHVSKKYDSRAVFQRLRRSGFKIPK
ncbi:FAD binding domain-containing [Fusarium longipes]|uniref:FAD binding domain-containing n=1 Tax=Fusarium longipes TaxID=694270 RepID=A0A395SX00_9HYPO|nr:FAD binding domain-containing [Fusarium longipes]